MKINLTQAAATLAVSGALIFAAPVAANASAPLVEAASTAADQTTALSPDLLGIDAGALLGFWAGGGALALAVAGITLAATVHRSRHRNAS